MTRQVRLTFFGDERWGQHATHAPSGTGATEPEPVAEQDRSVAATHTGGGTEPHDAPWTMAVPLVSLAVLAFAGGLVNLPFGRIGDALERIRRGTFGKCEECAAAIPKGRLAALPYARHCVACARKFQQPS